MVKITSWNAACKLSLKLSKECSRCRWYEQFEFMLLILLLQVDAVAGGDVECDAKKFIYRKKLSLWKLSKNRSSQVTSGGANSGMLFFCYCNFIRIFFLVHSIQNFLKLTCIKKITRLKYFIWTTSICGMSSLFDWLTLSSIRVSMMMLDYFDYCYLFVRHFWLETLRAPSPPPSLLADSRTSRSAFWYALPKRCVKMILSLVGVLAVWVNFVSIFFCVWIF